MLQFWTHCIAKDRVPQIDLEIIFDYSGSCANLIGSLLGLSDRILSVSVRRLRVWRLGFLAVGSRFSAGVWIFKKFKKSHT